jgi:hypothetical protein
VAFVFLEGYMASSSNDPTTGAPVFLDSDAPDPAVNPSEVAGFAASVGTRLIGSTTERNAYAYGRDGLRWYDTTLKTEYRDDGTNWRAELTLQKAFTWSRANVDSTAQYPELVEDVGNTTESSLASFQRVSGVDPDGIAGVKVPTPGVYHVSVGMNLAAVAGGRSFIQIGLDTDQYRQRSTVHSGEDQLSVNQIVRTTAVDQVIPIWFYKSNGNLGVNTGRVMVRRLG